MFFSYTGFYGKMCEFFLVLASDYGIFYQKSKLYRAFYKNIYKMILHNSTYTFL